MAFCTRTKVKRFLLWCSLSCNLLFVIIKFQTWYALESVDVGVALFHKDPVWFKRKHSEVINALQPRNNSDVANLASRLLWNYRSCNQIIQKPRASTYTMTGTHWHLQMYNEDKIMVSTAFYNDRPADPNSPNINLLVVSTLSQPVPLYCQVWYNEIDQPHVVPVVFVYSKGHSTMSNVFYYKWVYICKLPGLIPLPKYVSLSPNSCGSSDIIVPVTVPDVPMHQVDFGACVSVSYGDIDFGILSEWIEINKLFGVSEFNVYNGSMSANMNNILKVYESEGTLRVNQWPPPLPPYDRIAVQVGDVAGLNDCLLQNMYRYKYIVVLDFDEFIVPRFHSNYSSMLQYIDMKYGLTKPYRSYTFRNVYYFQEDKQDETQPKYLTTMRLRRRLNPGRYLFKPKSFINPLDCLSVFSHYCKVGFPESKGFTIDVPTDIAMSHHYRKCNYEPEECDYFLKMSFQDDFMLRFKSSIEGPVKYILEKAGYFK